LVLEMNRYAVNKPWGCEVVYAFDSYVVKKLYIDKDHKLSLQYHEKKHETLVLLEGNVWLWSGPDRQNLNGIRMHPGHVHVIEPGTVHRMEAEEDSIILECSTTELDDVVRLHDDYGRADVL